MGRSYLWFPGAWHSGVGIRNCTWAVSVETHVHTGISGEEAYGSPDDMAPCVHTLKSLKIEIHPLPQTEMWELKGLKGGCSLPGGPLRSRSYKMLLFLLQKILQPLQQHWGQQPIRLALTCVPGATGDTWHTVGVQGIQLGYMNEIMWRTSSFYYSLHVLLTFGNILGINK